MWKEGRRGRRPGDEGQREGQELKTRLLVLSQDEKLVLSTLSQDEKLVGVVTGREIDVGVVTGREIVGVVTGREIGVVTGREIAQCRG